MTDVAISDTPVDSIGGIVERSAAAADEWAAAPRDVRASALRAVADRLDAVADSLVETAMRETHLAEPRLRGELHRTTFQLRLFAEVVDDGAYLGVRIDHADQSWPMGPRPELRRMLQPLGPVVVFAASNFPFAFSVAGGDTASALAAGCSVVVKAHPGHPELSEATGRAVADALAEVGAPDGLFQLVHGVEAGKAALLHPLVKAGAFTGSIAGGRALFDLASSRPEPIPFYGELGSVNPVFVTRGAAEARGDSIAEEFLASFAMGAGQFCTKPGILLVPADSQLPAILEGARLAEPSPLLNEGIRAGHERTREALSGRAGVRVLTRGTDSPEHPAPLLLTVDVALVLADVDALAVECFGPTALVVTYRDDDELFAVARALHGQLTATLVAEPDDEVVPELMRLLAKRAGRLLWNQWPTGVSVTYAQHHGGPYPATTAPTTTSVGTAAIDRFLRPIAYQGFPPALLPAELQDGSVVTGLVDGEVVR